MARPYHAIIFDLDGTLLDTLDDLTHAFNTACEPFGCRRYHPQEYKRLIGHGVKQVIATLFEQHKIPAGHLERCGRIFQEAYLATKLERTAPYPGIHEMLQRLTKNKIILNVLSNKPHHDTERCMQQFFNIDQFKIIWGHQNSKPLKPDPMTTREILTMCRIPCEKGLFIGDTAVDIETAHNANMYAVGVTWGFRTRDELEAYGADTIVDDPTEIVRLCS
jgi:phosphoglycolate phosphatase